MGKLICLLGKSGSGKDTLFHSILNDDTIHLTPVVSYTTRPKRANETDGVQYHFVSIEEMNKFNNENMIIEKREYNTIKGLWCYFTVKFNIDTSENFILITTPTAIPKFVSTFGEDKIIVVYLDTDDKIRLERAILRESNEKNPNYSEICRRYLADEIDFKDVRFNQPNFFKINSNLDITLSVEQFKKILKNISENPLI